jgi:agmatinase
MINFGGIPEEYSDTSAPVVILPVPYDATSTWIKGSDKGPEAILEASANMELFDIETQKEVYLEGIYTAPLLYTGIDPEKMVQQVYLETKNYLSEGKFVVMIGGEHSITAGPVKAYVEKYSDLSVLQLDAHSDLRNEYEGSPYNHACVMARVQELCPLVQVGIRSMDVAENERIIPQRMFWAQEVAGRKGWHERAIDQLTEHVYISIDLDVFDPSIMPSTGTPEPGGLYWYETLEFLRKVVHSRKVVGFDIVELCPVDNNKGPDFLAAKLLYKLLSYISLHK